MIIDKPFVNFAKKRGGRLSKKLTYLPLQIVGAGINANIPILTLQQPVFTYGVYCHLTSNFEMLYDKVIVRELKTPSEFLI